MHRALWWQVLGQGAPLAAGSQHIEDAVQNLTDIDLSVSGRHASPVGSTVRLAPLGIGQIARVAKTIAAVKTTVLSRPLWPPPKNESMALQDHK